MHGRDLHFLHTKPGGTKPGGRSGLNREKDTAARERPIYDERYTAAPIDRVAFAARKREKYTAAPIDRIDRPLKMTWPKMVWTKGTDADSPGSPAAGPVLSGSDAAGIASAAPALHASCPFPPRDEDREEAKRCTQSNHAVAAPAVAAVALNRAHVSSTVLHAPKSLRSTSIR